MGIKKKFDFMQFKITKNFYAKDKFAFVFR